MGKVAKITDILKWHDFLTLVATALTNLLTFVDASFAVHLDMKSHTEGGVSFGKGFFMTRSTKQQRINTTRSTESEIVGAADYLPSTIFLSRPELTGSGTSNISPGALFLSCPAGL